MHFLKHPEIQGKKHGYDEDASILESRGSSGAPTFSQGCELTLYKMQQSGFMQASGARKPRNGSAISSLCVLKPATYLLCALTSSIFVENKNAFYRPYLGTK